MAEIAHAFAEQTALQSTSDNTNWTDVVSMASTSFVVGGKYWLYVIGESSRNAGASFSHLRVVHGSTAFDESVAVMTTRGSVAYICYAWQTVWTAISGEAVALQHKVFTGGTDTIDTDNAEIVAIRLDADLTENTDWFFVEDAADLSLTTTYQDGASKTFTPGTASHDWLCVAMSQVDVTNTTNAVATRINAAGTVTDTVPECIGHPSNNNYIIVHTLMRVYEDLAASSQTFKEQSASITANAHTRFHSSIFLLDLDKFKEHAQAYTAADLTLGTTAWADAIQTVGITPSSAGDVLFLGWWGADIGGGATGDVVSSRSQVDDTDAPGTQTTDAYTLWTGRAAADEYQVAHATIENVTAAAHTLDLDGHKGASATAPTAQYRSAIAVTMNLAAAALTTEQTLPAWVHQRLTVALGRSYV